MSRQCLAAADVPASSAFLHSSFVALRLDTWVLFLSQAVYLYLWYWTICQVIENKATKSYSHFSLYSLPEQLNVTEAIIRVINYTTYHIGLSS